MSTLKKLLLIWIAVIVLILVGAQFIVTDSKRVNRVLQATEQAVRDGDADGVMAQIANNYQYQGLDQPTLEDHTRKIFRRSKFSTTVLRNKKIKVGGESAEIRFTAFTQPAQGSPLPPSNTAWRLKLQKRDRQWTITEIELLTVDGHAVGSLRQMMEIAEGMGE